MAYELSAPPVATIDAATSAMLREAESRGVSLWVDGERLCYRCRDGSMPPDLRSSLQARKPDLIRALRGPQFTRQRHASCTIPLPPHQLDWWGVYAVNTVQANFTQVVIKLSGKLAGATLHAAMSGVFSRHDLLRARFEIKDSVACLAFSDDKEAVVTVLGATDDARPEQQLLDEMVWNPLEQGSVFRAFLLQRSADCYIMGFVLYHLVGDGWSCVTLIRELLEAIGRPQTASEQAAPKPLQYSDYLLGLNDWLQSPACELQLRYWRDAMRQAPPTRLPEDHDVGAAAAGPLPHMDISIAAPLRTQIVEAAAEASVTMLTVLLAAKFITLHRLSGATDLTVTSCIAARGELAVLGMVGATANLLPVRITLDTDLTFASLLTRAQEAHAVAVRHQVPWRLLMHTIAQAGASVVSPMLNFVPFAGEQALQAGEGHGMRVEVVPMATPPEVGIASWHSSHEMFLIDTGQEIRGALKYLALRYRPEIIQRFFDTYIETVARCTAAPHSRICDLFD